MTKEKRYDEVVDGDAGVRVVKKDGAAVLSIATDERGKKRVTVAQTTTYWTIATAAPGGSISVRDAIHNGLMPPEEADGGGA